MFWFALPPPIFISVVETGLSEIFRLDSIISISSGIIVTGIITAAKSDQRLKTSTLKNIKLDLPREAILSLQ